MTDFVELARLDAVAQSELVRSGELTSRDLLDACEKRVALVEPLIHAIASLDFYQARSRADSARAGPFAGVPFLVKDVAAFPGFGWQLGSRLLAENVASAHTPLSQRIEEAGLVVFGKSTTSEFGLLGSTETLRAGVTHNPWNLAISALGSSGGAAAAVASGIVPVAHASDAGGSIRIPASACGLFGFKPTNGRTVPPADGSSDFMALTPDHCISRSVRDSARLLALLDRKQASGDALGGEVRRPLERRLKLGFYTRTLTGREPVDAVRRELERTLALCAELGHTVLEISAPAIDGPVLGRAFFTVAGAALQGFFETMSTTLGRPVARDDVERFTFELVERQRRAEPGSVERARATFEQARACYLEATRHVDVVVTPTLPVLPWELGTLSPVLGFETLVARTEERVTYTPIHNVVGCPAMSVPLGWSDAGLPIGIHFAAAPEEDALLLALALELESAAPWRDRWAPWSCVQLI